MRTPEQRKQATARQRQYDAERRSDPERQAEYLERCRTWYARNKARAYATTRRNRLKEVGLTEGDYAAMVLAQGGLCAVCLRPPREPDTRLCIDHAHDTGQVRGLLCRSCNAALGLLGDDIVTLRRAVAYMDQAVELSA